MQVRQSCAVIYGCSEVEDVPATYTRSSLSVYLIVQITEDRFLECPVSSDRNEMLRDWFSYPDSKWTRVSHVYHLCFLCFFFPTA